MGREPGAGLRRALEGRAEALAGTFNAQDVEHVKLWRRFVSQIFDKTPVAPMSSLKRKRDFGLCSWVSFLIKTAVLIWRARSTRRTWQTR